MCHTWEGDQVPNWGMHTRQNKWHHSFLHFVTISSHCMRLAEKEHICRHKYHGASLELLWWIGVPLIPRFLSPNINAVSLLGALAKMMQVKSIWNGYVGENTHRYLPRGHDFRLLEICSETFLPSTKLWCHFSATLQPARICFDTQDSLIDIPPFHKSFTIKATLH